MTIYALDPGPERSALVCLMDGQISGALLLDNMEMLRRLPDCVGGVLVIEQVRSYGMAVGAEVFETVRWSGRFEQIWDSSGYEVVYLPRLAVKLAICKSARAKDSNIRQAIVDAYGGKERAIGRKANPGPLYGIKADLWAALAVGLTYQQLQTTHSDGA